jgi:PHD/YefM family antitoxin component YafN of YafNO toxin-antitoxin module
LEELYQFLNLKSVLQETYLLNKHQSAAIQEARKQLENGDFITNEQAN